MLAPHVLPTDVVATVRKTAKTYDELVTARLLMHDVVKPLFLVNELARCILNVLALRAKEKRDTLTTNEAALRFALFEKLFSKELYDLVFTALESETVFSALRPFSPLVRR